MFRVALMFLLVFGVVHVESKLCPSLRLINDVKRLERLRNCTHILGNLQILLMTRTDSSREFDKYVFPELRTITGYLMFYSVSKLTSIGKLFPGLRVIKGSEMFLHYSLVIFSMEDLREIGTTNLLFIARGYVKVDRCPLLCYVDTIDWSKLGDVRLHFNNMNSEGCEACPKGCGGYCWNSMHCQDTEAAKCHEECLGCSKKHSARHCDACKNYEYNNTCIPECPLNTYAHTRCYKCVTAHECRQNVYRMKGEWWPFENECVDDCPVQYEITFDKNQNIVCRYCGENCTKRCNVTDEVDTMDGLQRLKGCTHIDGSLVLKLADLDPSRIIGDLDVFLGSVRYIRDSLVIGRSEAVTSLMFLQNLTLIEGKKLENQHAIFIYDNENLQMLWNFSEPNFNLTIKNGSVAFHDNPLLCVSEIMKLISATGVNYSEVDVSVYSNGDKAACNKTDLVVDFQLSAHAVNMSWKPQVCHGECIGYTIFYRPVRMNQNVTGFDSKDECLDNKWNSTFTSKNCTTLKELNAYTRYAYYIKIYHQKSRQLTQSNINYFITKPDSPGDPEFLNSRALDSHTIRLEWKRPSQINGNLSKYIVHIDSEPDNIDLRNLRNYCEDPITIDGDKIDKDSKLFMNKDTFDLYLENLANQENTDPMRENKCLCKTKKKPNPEWFKDLSIVNVDRYLHICDIHSMSKFGFDECKEFVYLPANDISFLSNRSREFYVEKRSQVKSVRSPEYLGPNLTAHNFTQLNYFSLYVFYFTACNEIENKLRCSGVEQTFARTKPKKDADDVEDVRVNVEDNSLVRISWTEPKHPNSMILAYKITYVEKGQEDAARRVKCIPRDDTFNTSEFILTNLSPGTYTITVHADSLAGPGRPSREETFEIGVPQNDITTVILWVCVVVVTIAVGTFFGFYWWKRTHPQRTFRDINPEYHGIEYEPDDWEIERSDVELESNLGHGTFGTVYYGRLKSKNLLCAVKTANENMSIKDRMEFLNEASVMKAFSNCHHVVRLIGVVSRGEPPLVIMELMERGDLKKYLHRTRDSSHTLTANEIYRMAVEIADGMAYLAAKKFVHRDLAARNCMVAADRTVKIGDFGVARDIYETDYYKKGTKGLLPVRWMAPESLADGVFTSDSDVWSYGIVLWEIATLAEQPYQGMSNEQVLQFVVSKGRLERPQECSDLFYEVMRQCWSWKPIDRPTFWDIVEKLEDHVGENFKVMSFIHSREGNEHRIIHGRARPYNPPAVSTDREEDLIGHYNVSDDEVSLHVGTAPHRPSFLQSSLSQSRDSRSSPSDFY